MAGKSNKWHRREKKIKEEIDELAQEYIEVPDPTIVMSEKKRQRMRTEFKKRAKRRKKKLTSKQIGLIMSQKGRMSTQECADWFYEKMSYHFKISKMTVWRHWNNKTGQKKKMDVLDLLDEMESSDMSVDEVVEKLENEELDVT